MLTYLTKRKAAHPLDFCLIQRLLRMVYNSIVHHSDLAA